MPVSAICSAPLVGLRRRNNVKELIFEEKKWKVGHTHILI